MEYVCTNPKCEAFGQKEYFSQETFKYKYGYLTGEHAQCPYCGMERDRINPNEKIPLSEKAIGVNLFNAMSVEQKQEALKKRSHEHFNKNIKERKDGLVNQAINEMRNINKR